MINPKMIYFLLRDFPKLRDYLYKTKIEEFPDEISEDIKNLRCVNGKE